MLKSDFPLFLHHPNLVYLDSGASAQKPKMVIDAVKTFCETSYANIHRGMYGLSVASTTAVETVRQKVATFVGASPRDIIFTKNATEAANFIANGLFKWVQKNSSHFEVVVTAADHHANFLPWQVLCKAHNINLKVIFPGQDGIFTTENILKEISKDTKILALPHVSNVTGQIFEIENITKQLNPSVFVVVDGSQSVPHLPVNMKNMGVDAMFFTGHKIGAGGTGAAVLSDRLFGKLEPLLYGGDMVETVTIDSYTLLPQPACFESGTPAIENIVGLGAAIDYIESIGGMHAIKAHEQKLIAYGIEQISQHLPKWHIVGPVDASLRSGNISLWHSTIHHEDIGLILAEKNICVRTGFHCAHPLHACLQSTGTVRASFWVYNDNTDIDAWIDGMKAAERLLE